MYTRRRSYNRQVYLELDDRRRVVPWDGRSPRELTRAWNTFTLKAQAGRVHERACIGREQLMLVFENKSSRGGSSGAPLLLPL